MVKTQKSLEIVVIILKIEQCHLTTDPAFLKFQEHEEA